MEFKELCDLIESAGYSYRSYTGRGMGNKVCLGIDTDNSSQEVALDLVSHYLNFCNGNVGKISVAQDLCETLKDSKTDSMGKGIIVYFPGIKWEELDSED